MAKEVTPNYTKEQEQAMLACGQIDNAKALELAAAFGKDVKSVRAKAVRMGIYKAAEKKSKSGGPIESKEEIASELANMLGITAAGIDKAPKEFLKAVRSALAARS